jgi:mono/diheme cytochrome c family protein
MLKVLLVAIICCTAALPARADDAVARGRYLAVLGDCAGCHSAPHQAPFSGGMPFTAQFGTLYSTNISPDKATGIGDWSEEDFYHALHDGVARGGKHLYPALPYVYFTRLTRQDTHDLFVFLRTVTPVHREPTPDKLIFPFSLRFGLIFWNWLYLDKTPLPSPAGVSAQWKRGEYLVNGLGHCAACHTPKDILFGDKSSKPLGGGKVENWFANALTGEKSGGLGLWSAADIEKFLATGISVHATAAGTMEEKVASSTSHMRDSDRAAIATYLKSLPAAHKLPAIPPGSEQMARGRAVLTAHCESCHAVPGGRHLPDQGRLAGYPELPGDTLVMGEDPTTVLHLILNGGKAPPAPGLDPKPMPSFAKLSDGQIADVASYIRNAWGNSAPTVSATAVHNLRRALAAQ